MFADYILLPHLWRRYLRVMRALLGVACLGSILASPRLGPSGLTVLLAVLSLYGVAALLWRRLHHIDSSLVTLALDTLLFLVYAAHRDEGSFWLSSFLAFYLLLSAALLHQWRTVLGVMVVAAGFLTVAEPGQSLSLRAFILLLGMFACVLALQKRSLLDRLSISSRQVVLFRSEAEAAREAERQRIAADFHDGPLQSFISLQMRLEIVRKMLERDKEKGMAELEQLQILCRNQVAELRSYVRGMRPLDVEGAGLVASLLRVIQTFQRDSGISVTFSGGEAPELEEVQASADVVQVVREALNNVQKHSNASRVVVSISRTDNLIQIRIEDDGRGFPFAGTFTLDELEVLRLGPVSIKRRVRGMNGDLTIDSRPGSGAGLCIRVPA